MFEDWIRRATNIVGIRYTVCDFPLNLEPYTLNLGPLIIPLLQSLGERSGYQKAGFIPRQAMTGV